MDTNKKKKVEKAVALKYSTEDRAPKVVAKGRGHAASRIVEMAKDEDIYIYKDENLIDSLIELEINEEIPEQLYEAVAEIIFFVYNLDINRGNRNE